MISDIVPKVLTAYRSGSHDIGVGEAEVLAIFHDDGMPKYWTTKDNMCRPDLGMFERVGHKLPTDRGHQLNCWHLIEEMDWL